MQPSSKLTDMRIRLSFLVFVFLACYANGQEKAGVKFGRVRPEDFKKIYSLDSNARAVVIAEIGSTDIEGNSKNSFSLEYKHYRRVQILNKNGFDEAEVLVHLYNSMNGEEKMDGIKAVTYNLEGGKVVE